MRFSLRWLLAATAYGAVAITAIASKSNVLADIVWGASWLALSFAVVVACLGRQRQQAAALGFLTLAAAHVAGLYLIPDRTPAMRLFSAAGYIVTSEGEVYEPNPGFPGQVYSPVGLRAKVSTVNAVGTLVIGLIGCLVGRIAYAYLDAAHRDYDSAN
jgi:hypothetical protein